MHLHRSSLYNIVPIGIGTIEVESLSSYISRLADAHCITVGDIMTHFIAPKMDKKYINNIVLNGGNGFYKSSSAINGYGIIAYDFIKIMSSLTCREDIRRTTLDNCRELVPFRGLLKNRRYWCSSCFQTDFENNKVIFERLSWTLQPIQECLIHDRALESVCPFCKSCMYTLERKSLPGYCGKCFSWLGSFVDSDHIKYDSQSKKKLINKFFIELTCMTVEKNNVASSLSFYIKNNFEGSLKRAADFFCFSKSTFWGWKEGRHLPPLSALIDIITKLELDLTDFLNTKKSNKVLLGDYSKLTNTGRVKKEHDKIQDFLNLIIREKRPYSLSMIAARLGCDRKLLTGMYPKECNNIKKNFLKHIEIKKQNKDELLKEKIDNAVYILKKRGTYPSSRKIEKIIGEGKLHEKKFQDYWKECKDNNLII